jgi:ATP-binding cassette subfamily C (CFTR/MRP) protein 10
MVLYRFRRKNEENVEANQKCQYASQAAGQWLSLRLQFIGVAMVTGIGFIAVLQHQFNVADPGSYKNKFGNVCIM